MKRILIAAALIAGPALRLMAGAGADAVPFLKIDAGARAAAMGGAFTAIADDASAVFYNPAGTGLMSRKELLLSHNEWISNLKNENLAYVHPSNMHLTLFTGINVLLSPSMGEYDENGNQTGNFTASEGALSAGMAWAFRENLYGAFALKGIYQAADKQSATAYAGDLGLLKDLGWARFGLAAQNLGTPMKLYQESFPLPLTLRGGAAFMPIDKLWLAADVIKAGQSGVAFAAGAEAEIGITETEALFARAGFTTGRTGSTGSGISAGMGLKSEDFRADYAFSPFGDLGDTHRLTVSFKFGEPRADPDAKAKVKHFAREKPAASRAASNKSKKAPAPKPDDGVYFMW